MEKGRRTFNFNFVFVIRFKKSKRRFVYKVVGFEKFIKNHINLSYDCVGKNVGEKSFLKTLGPEETLEEGINITEDSQGNTNNNNTLII